MNVNRIPVPALVVFLGLSGSVLSGTSVAAQQGPPPGYYNQDRGGWDAPPGELNEIQRRGFHDGIEGARRDVDNHRNPDPNNRDEYRHPNVDHDLWKAYRMGFRRGYQLAMSHLLAAPGMQAAQPELPWDAPRPEWNEIQRRGFQDGIAGARRDIENHRQPNVENRDEYRNPSVEYDLRGAYRDSFRRGYDVAMSRLMGGPGTQMAQPQLPWDAPRPEWNEIQRQGFHDGIEGAHKDYDNHRRPDVNNRDEYRNPHLPPGQAMAYREGFQQGYQRAMSHLMGDRDQR